MAELPAYHRDAFTLSIDDFEVRAARPATEMPTKLLIATPFYEMKGFSPYITSLVHTCKMLAAAGIEFDFWELSGDSYVDRARNTIANKFMDSDYSHLIFIDSDHKWDLDGFVNLLKADADVVGAGYPCKNKWDFFSCILEDSPDHRPIVNEQGLIKAWGVPTGFMKIRREVFVKLAEKMPENYYMTGDPDTGEQSKVFNFFGRIPPMGEDISFCRRWAGIGGELWVEPRVTITHFGVKGWEGNYHDFLTSCPGGSTSACEHFGGGEGVQGCTDPAWRNVMVIDEGESYSLVTRCGGDRSKCNSPSKKP